MESGLKSMMIASFLQFLNGFDGFRLGCSCRQLSICVNLRKRISSCLISQAILLSLSWLNCFDYYRCSLRAQMVPQSGSGAEAVFQHENTAFRR